MSSVHTSDLSSFEGESEDDDQKSDSSEEGELPADGLFFLLLAAKTNCDVFRRGNSVNSLWCLYFFDQITVSTAK